MMMMINSVIVLLKCLHLPTHMHQDVDGCIVRYAMVHAKPNVQQALLLFVNVMHPQLINSLLDDTPYFVVKQTGLFDVAPDLVQWKTCSLLEKSYSVTCPVCKCAVNI